MTESDNFPPRDVQALIDQLPNNPEDFLTEDDKEELQQALTAIHNTLHPCWADAPPVVPLPRYREYLERTVANEIVRDILVAMCHKQGISTQSPYDPEKEAANFILAQRLGIGAVFGLPDHEETP